MARRHYHIDDAFQMRLYRIGDPVFMDSDWCLNCTLSFDCDETSKECRYVIETGRKPELGRTAVTLATEEERKENVRRIKRESMRRARAKQKEQQCTT